MEDYKPPTYITMLDKKCYMELQEVAARVEGKYVYTGGRWVGPKKKYEDFARDQVSEEKIQWFIDITS